MVEFIICVAAGYLLGSVSIAVIYTKNKYRRDVRNEGSGNAGATNVARVFGMKSGLLVLAGDTLKTALSAFVGFLLCGETGLCVAIAACLIGHCFPLFFSFRGGKGVSVAAAIALILDWRMFLITASVFFALFYLTRIVSVCSVISTLCFAPVYYLFNRELSPAFYLCVFVAVTVCFMHRSNIKRLLRKEEKKFEPKK